MSFDYSVAGSVGASGGSATLEILFTSNGTETLWTKTINAASTLPIQKRGELITLPAATSPGRLTFKLVIVGGLTSGNVVTQTNMTFGIDNLVVQ